MDVRDGPSVTLSGAELGPLHRQILEAVRMFRRRDGLAPFEFLQLAIAVNRAVNGSPAEPVKPPDAASLPASEQPAGTFLSVQEAAKRLDVSTSWVWRLVRRGILEARASKGPIQVYADSVAAHQERRRRKEDDRRAA